MSASTRFADECRYILQDYEGECNPIRREAYDLSFNERFSMCLEIPTMDGEHRKNEVEIPVLARKHIENALSESCRKDTLIDKIVVPLFVGAEDAKSTFDAIWHTVLGSRNNWSYRLYKITAKNNDVYYIGRGIILDEDFNLLLLMSGVAEYMEEAQNYKYNRIIIRIDPKVFQRSCDLICKNIIKKVIPFYVSSPLWFNDSSSPFISVGTSILPDVLVTPLKGIIKTPSRPHDLEHIQEELQQCLIDNVAEIVKPWIP